MKASQQFEKGIKVVCQHGKGIKAFFSSGEIKHKHVTCALILKNFSLLFILFHFICVTLFIFIKLKY